MVSFITALLPAFIAALPLFGPRFIPTHDGEYHIIRFWQFYIMLSEGSWFPRWAPDLNNGLGIPLFTFQYPFPNYVGSLFHLFGLSFVDSVRWTLASGYLVALIFCYLFLHRVFGKKPAVIGTITGAFVPYWFVDIYIRGSVGEVWALAWVFAALFAVTYGRSAVLSVAVGLLILSHNILALLFVPIVGIYAFFKNRRYIADMALGIGIASYFWIPALYEQRYITGLSPVRVFDHFPMHWQLLVPSWGSGFRGQITGGNEMSYQVGLVPLVLLFVSLAAFIKNRNARTRETVFAALCMLGAILLMLPNTAWIWKTIPFAHFIQYPWRLLSVVVVMTPMLAAALSARFRYGWIMAIGAVLLAYGYSRPVYYEPRTDAYYLSKENFTRGTSSLGDAFQTKWLRPEHITETPEFVFDGRPVETYQKNPTEYVVTLTATGSGQLTAPIAYYPGWNAFKGNEKLIVFPDENGLVSVTVPQHTDGITIRLNHTTVQVVAIYASMLSLLVVMCLNFRKYVPKFSKIK